MKTLLCVVSIVFLSGSFLAQGVGINATGSGPDPSAGLDVNFSDKGFLPPRMTTLQRDSIQNPATMLIIANITTNCLEIYIAPNWQNIFCGCTSAPANLSYTNNGPISYCLNTGITPNNATTQASTPNSYNVNPSLPAGLQLNNVNGQITGTPIALSTSTNYTVTASNACGSTTQMLNMEVISVPASPSSISGPSAPTINTSVNYSISAASGASSYVWTVPMGWTINSGQGTTTINITAGSNAGNITVTASNTCGNSATSTKAVSSWRPLAATGGTITNYTANGSDGVNGIQYRVHSYTAIGNSSFSVSDAGSDSLVDYLIVGGGGEGGNGTIPTSWENGGGGGAGGVRQGNGLLISASVYPVLIGAGGSTGSGGTTTPGVGSANGNPSSAFGLTADGGGRGGMRDHNRGDGGSGGGGPAVGTISSGGLGNSGQGYNGGDGSPLTGGNGGGGGGGGAAAAGGNGNSSTGGNGGNGILVPWAATVGLGSNGYFAGGGGASGAVAGTGGLGGGGDGSNSGNGAPAVANTGGGGGGARSGVNTSGGSGGSGIVIIRYPLFNPNP
jgi:hypothetical protein